MRKYNNYVIIGVDAGYIAARGIYTNAGGLTTRDLADAEVVDAAALRMIVNALLIARYGCAVLDIDERGRKA